MPPPVLETTSSTHERYWPTGVCRALSGPSPDTRAPVCRESEAMHDHDLQSSGLDRERQAKREQRYLIDNAAGLMSVILRELGWVAR